jgi:hypothetical protein
MRYHRWVTLIGQWYTRDSTHGLCLNRYPALLSSTDSRTGPEHSNQTVRSPLLQLRIFRLACFRMGMSGSASFQRVRKS